MYINEDLLTKWVKNNKGLCITRSINNVDQFDFNQEYMYPVILTGYRHILDIFFTQIIQHIKTKFVLILIESDVIQIHKDELENEKIVHCFTWNKPYNHEKITALPIGLNFKRQFKSLVTWIVNNKIDETYIYSEEERKQQKLVCFNCNLNTSPERKVLQNVIQTHMTQFCDKLAYVPFLESKIIGSHIEGKIKIDITDPKCYDDWRKYKFILSPEGAGFDCHRTWEAIFIGVIPIVKTSNIDDLFTDLPVVIVNDWADLSLEFLNTKYDEIMANKQQNVYNYEKLHLDYWTKIISNKLFELI